MDSGSHSIFPIKETASDPAADFLPITISAISLDLGRAPSSGVSIGPFSQGT
jgi:hypothetical protein